MADPAKPIAQAERLLERLRTHGLLENRLWTLSCQPGSPWLLLTIDSAEPCDRARIRTHCFAIWQETGAIHPMHNGEASEDPIELEEVDLP